MCKFLIIIWIQCTPDKSLPVLPRCHENIVSRSLGPGVFVDCDTAVTGYYPVKILDKVVSNKLRIGIVILQGKAPEGMGEGILALISRQSNH